MKEREAKVSMAESGRNLPACLTPFYFRTSDQCLEKKRNCGMGDVVSA
jgi:hypothetical protein